MSHNELLLERIISSSIDDNERCVKLFESIRKGHADYLGKKTEGANDLFGLIALDLLKYCSRIVLSENHPSRNGYLHSIPVWPYYIMTSQPNDSSTHTERKDFIWGRRVPPEPIKESFARAAMSLASMLSFNHRSSCALVISGDVCVKCYAGASSLAEKYELFSMNKITKLKKYKIDYFDRDINLLEDIIWGVIDKSCIHHKEAYFSVFKSHISAIIKDTYTVFDSDRPIVLWGATDFRSRLQGFVALNSNSNAKVVRMAHGHGVDLLREPIFGEIGDKAFCSHWLSIGDFAIESVHGSRRVSKVSYRSNLIKYKNCIPVRLSIEEKFSFVYVPTSFSRPDNRYGPYRDLNNNDYLEWFQILASVFSSKLFIKLHPKGQIDQDVEWKIRQSFYILTNYTVEELAHYGSILVFDYVSSALFEAWASKTPIIFLDLGVRHLSPVGKKALQERCAYMSASNFISTEMGVSKLKQEAISKADNHTTEWIFEGQYDSAIAALTASKEWL